MLRNTSKRVAWIGLFLWISGCYEDAPPASDAAVAAVPPLPTSPASPPSAAAAKRKPRADAPVVGDDSLDAGTCSDADAGPLQLEGQTISLWPPNHKFHDIAVADCVRVQSGCGSRGEFIWASSDEPVDDKGDGHHSPDILIADDCQRVSVRSERQGPKDGRVYKLGVRVVDADGSASEASCTIVIDHDRRGVLAADSGEKYRLTFDGSAGGPICDGAPPPPPPQDPPAEPDAATPDAATLDAEMPDGPS